jgi:hypothetical protein
LDETPLDFARYDVLYASLFLVDYLLTRPEEGSLATSLYFQFEDKAVSLSQEAARLSELAINDLRYKSISQNVNSEVGEVDVYTGR